LMLSRRLCCVQSRLEEAVCVTSLIVKAVRVIFSSNIGCTGEQASHAGNAESL